MALIILRHSVLRVSVEIPCYLCLRYQWLTHFRYHLNLELLYFVSSFLNYYITKGVLIYQKRR